MNNSASLTAVQGPSMVAHMIVMSLSQLPPDSISSLQWVRLVKTLTCVPSFCYKSGSNRKLSHVTVYQQITQGDKKK
jgi:hypothetical protein